MVIQNSGIHVLIIPMIVRDKHIQEVVGISPSHAKRLSASGMFPQRRKWSNAVSGWNGVEIFEWIKKYGEVTP